MTMVMKKKCIRELFNNVIILFQKVNQNIIIHSLINKSITFVKQHKLVSSAIVAISIVAIPNLISSNSHYPNECRGLIGQVRSNGSGGMPWNDDYVPELSSLAFEEDPEGVLGKGGMFLVYDDNNLPKLFDSKYSRLLTSSGKDAAELYREKLSTACYNYRKKFK